MNNPQERVRAFGEGTHRLLLVASTGGHLAQLTKLAHAHGASDESVWVTFDSPQSRSLLDGKEVIWVDYVSPRDVKGVIKAFRKIERILDSSKFDGVLSTGAAVALSGFLWGRKHRLPTVYIESCSRTEGPSITGRVTRALRLAVTHTQHESWASEAWKLVPSVMGQFEKVVCEQVRDPEDSFNILVSLGTIKPYRFDRLVDRVCAVAKDDDRIVWQLGETTRESMPGESHRLLPADTFLKQAKEADVVIIHSGMGTILQLLDNGISPIVVPRRKEHKEHVDNHQLQIWKLLSNVGVGIPVEVENLRRIHFAEAASTRTVTKGS